MYVDIDHDAHVAPHGPQEAQHGGLVARVDAALPVPPALLGEPQEVLQRLLPTAREPRSPLSPLAILMGLVLRCVIRKS